MKNNKIMNNNETLAIWNNETNIIWNTQLVIGQHCCIPLWPTIDNKIIHSPQFIVPNVINMNTKFMVILMHHWTQLMFLPDADLTPARRGRLHTISVMNPASRAPPPPSGPSTAPITLTQPRLNEIFSKPWTRPEPGTTTMDPRTKSKDQRGGVSPR